MVRCHAGSDRITATVAGSGADGARGDAEPSGFFDEIGFFAKMNLAMNNQMRIGTGSKTRSIKSELASVDGLFEFNKSMLLTVAKFPR